MVKVDAAFTFRLRRNFLSPMMLAFDAPIPFSTFGKRNSSNVPAQSLMMLNDPFVAEQADAWASALVTMPHATIEERVTDIYLSALSRNPIESELAQARDYLESAVLEMEGHVEDVMGEEALWAQYCHVVFNLKEFIYLI